MYLLYMDLQGSERTYPLITRGEENRVNKRKLAVTGERHLVDGCRNFSSEPGNFVSIVQPD